MLYYIYRNIILTLRDIFKRIPKVLLSGFGIIFLISFLVLFLSLRSSARDYIQKRIFNQLNINEIKVTPVNKTQFINLNLFSQTKNEISSWKISKIKKMPGTKSIQKIIRLNLPTSLKAGMLGRYMRTDILISGVERSFFQGTKVNWKNFKPGNTIPMVIPYFALDLYNNFASTNNLPELGEKALLGFPAKLTIGESSFFRDSREKYDYDARIYGFSSKLTTTGIIVPSEFIRNFCKSNGRDSGKGDGCYSSTMLIIQVKNTSMIPEVAGSIKRLGLNVESHSDIAKKTGKAVSFIDGIFLLLLAIILILSVIAIFNSYLAVVYNRSYEISLQRVLGVSKIRIMIVILLEAAVVGLIYGITGYFAGYYLVQYLSESISQWIPLLKGLKISMTIDGLLPFSVGISMLVSSLSALVPAIFASNLNLFLSLQKQK